MSVGLANTSSDDYRISYKFENINNANISSLRNISFADKERCIIPTLKLIGIFIQTSTFQILKVLFICVILPAQFCATPLHAESSNDELSIINRHISSNHFINPTEYPDEVYAAIELNNYPVLLRELPQYADNGDELALEILSNILINGDEEYRDIQKGKKYLLRNVPSASGLSEYYLGLACDFPVNTRIDYECAISWYEKSHALGYDESTYRLGMLLNYIEATNKNQTCLECYERVYELLSSLKGIEEYELREHYNLVIGTMEVAPLGTEQNIESGIAHLEKAAQGQDNLFASMMLHVIHAEGLVDNSTGEKASKYKSMALQKISEDKFNQLYEQINARIKRH